MFVGKMSEARETQRFADCALWHFGEALTCNQFEAMFELEKSFPQKKWGIFPAFFVGTAVVFLPKTLAAICVRNRSETRSFAWRQLMPFWIFG